MRLHIKITEILQEQNRKIKSCLVYVVLVNSNILTANYGVKQRQFTKLTSEPHVSDPEESNEVFDRAIR